MLHRKGGTTGLEDGCSPGDPGAGLERKPLAALHGGPSGLLLAPYQAWVQRKRSPSGLNGAHGRFPSCGPPAVVSSDERRQGSLRGGEGKEKERGRRLEKGKQGTGTAHIDGASTQLQKTSHCLVISAK